MCRARAKGRNAPALTAPLLSAVIAATVIAAPAAALAERAAVPPATPVSVPAPKYELMPAIEGRDYGKPRMRPADFVMLDSGVQYKDAKVGGDASVTPQRGDRVVFDWSGYTIGYYGRVFEAKNKTRGGAFAEEREHTRYVFGEGRLIPALEEAMATMHPGGIRQVIVPPERGYPADDPRHTRVGPRPSTFSGMRALNFVLENRGLIDKTLLINVELVRVDKQRH